jgi:hypothetical protein
MPSTPVVAALEEKRGGRSATAAAREGVREEE